MAAGERVAADIGQYAASSMEIDSREQIYSAMVVYGLLTYADGEVFIPNKELMDQFNEMLLSKDSLGYVYQLARKSEQMLQATLAGDTKTMEEILQFAHDTESPVLSYNSEVELSAVVNLCYLSARNRQYSRLRIKNMRIGFRENWAKTANIQGGYWRLESVIRKKQRSIVVR